jgi:hypothetical protein
MTRTLRYRLRATPEEILDIAASRLEERPGAVLAGDARRGTLKTRSFSVSYAMEPSHGETELTITLTRKPPVPWVLIKTYLDKEAGKW